MSMSRKDYNAIAEAIVSVRAATPYDALRYVDAVTSNIADVLAADNPRFDRDRFLAALIPPAKTYKIVRFSQGKPGKVIATGYTLEQAQAHCQDDTTHGEDWFDGYDEE